MSDEIHELRKQLVSIAEELSNKALSTSRTPKTAKYKIGQRLFDKRQVETTTHFAFYSAESERDCFASGYLLEVQAIVTDSDGHIYILWCEDSPEGLRYWSDCEYVSNINHVNERDLLPANEVAAFLLEEHGITLHPTHQKELEKL